ncbi:MAG: hypothetical protein KC478_08675 [Bacteriovoracaceae bacterium]|nr:hypothetical protein [Bacteriovoracaceae bacterium]
MFKVSKTIAAAAVLSTLAIPTGAFASDIVADSVSNCGVPVCDMQATLKKLEKMNESERYSYANQMKNDHLKTTNVEVLNNLIELGQEMKKISQVKGDADWVIREAAALANNAILNLAKYSEMNAEAISTLYMKLDNATKRYEVIAFWQSQVHQIEDVQVLEELIHFAKNAQDHSIAIEDEGWIPRAASSLASEATVRLVALEPAHEGVYQVEITNAQSKMLGFDRVIVLDSTSSSNLAVHFVNTTLNQTVFAYEQATILGNTISGTSLSSNGMSSKFELQFDRETGVISGEIQSTRNKLIEFNGSRNFTVQDLIEGKAPYTLESNDVIGTMQGSILGVEGELSIQSFAANTYSASFISKNGELVMDFHGKFFPKRGVLALTHNNKVKLVLALRAATQGILWQGASFSTTNGEVNTAIFTPLN